MRRVARGTQADDENFHQTFCPSRVDRKIVHNEIRVRRAKKQIMARKVSEKASTPNMHAGKDHALRDTQFGHGQVDRAYDDVLREQSLRRRHDWSPRQPQGARCERRTRASEGEGHATMTWRFCPQSAVMYSRLHFFCTTSARDARAAPQAAKAC